MTIVAAFVALLAMVLAALCAAADGALLKGDETLRTDTAEEPSLRPWREHSHRALSIGLLAFQLLAGAGFAVALGFGSAPPGAALLAAGVIVLAVVALTEALPRALGSAAGAPLAGAVRPFIRAMEVGAGPLVRLSFAMDRGLRRTFPVAPPSETEREDTAARFREIVTAEADVPAEQQAVLNRVFELGDTEVHAIMVPRVDIVALDQQTPWGEVVARVRSAEHSRLPVYDESIDRVIGILHAKDLLGAVAADEPPDDWRALVRPAVFIPESKTADAQLRDFKRTGTHIAIVVDEYGGTAGLLTLEDVLEEIVGDIRDEYDREEPPIEAQGDRCFWVAGRVSLEDFSEAVGHEFEREDVTTVGGLVFDALGRVPRSGEELTINGFRVVVERVVRRRVERVYFERLARPAERMSR